MEKFLSGISEDEIIEILKTNSDCFGEILLEKFNSIFLRLQSTLTIKMRDDRQVADSPTNLRWSFAFFIEFVVWVTTPPLALPGESCMERSKRQADHRPLRELFHTFLNTEYAKIIPTNIEPVIFTPSTYYKDNYLLDTWEEITIHTEQPKHIEGYTPYEIYRIEPDSFEDLKSERYRDKLKVSEIVTLRQIARFWKELWQDEWTDLVSANQDRMKTLDMSNPLLTRDLLFNQFLNWIITESFDEEHPFPLWNMFSNWMDDRVFLGYETKFLSFLCHTDTLKLRKVKWSVDQINEPEDEDFIFNAGSSEHWYCEDCRRRNLDLFYNETFDLLEEMFWTRPRRHTHDNFSKYLEWTIQDYIYDDFENCQQHLKELKEQIGHEPTVEEVHTRFPNMATGFDKWLILGIQTTEDFIRVTFETDNSDK